MDPDTQLMFANMRFSANKKNLAYILVETRRKITIWNLDDYKLDK